MGSRSSKEAASGKEGIEGRGEEGRWRRGEMEGRSHSILWMEMRTLAFALSERKGSRGF